MANYPLSKKVYIQARSFCDYPIIDFKKIYYTVIDGKLMAIKPLVGYFTVTDYGSEQYWLKVYAANGKEYTIRGVGALYNNKDEYFAFVNGVKQDIKIPRGHFSDIFSKIGVTMDSSNNYFLQYYWYKTTGTAGASRGKIALWFDIDGTHYELLSENENGKLYKDRGQCIEENSGVVEFGDDLIVPDGTYTVVREFTVQAPTEEAAQSIVDNAIGKKLCVTKK